MKALYIFQRSRRFGESRLGKTNVFFFWMIGFLVEGLLSKKTGGMRQESELCRCVFVPKVAFSP